MQIIVNLILVLAVTFFCGCSSIHHRPRREHVVAVSEEGKLEEFTQVGSKHKLTKLVDQKRQVMTNAYAAYFTRITDNIQKQKRTNIVLFAQGGLNNIQDGVNRSYCLTDAILADGSYPVFLAWNASLFSTYGDYIVKIRRGKVAEVAGPLTAPLYLLADIGRATAHAPVTWFHQGQSDWKGLFLHGSPYSTDCKTNTFDWLNRSVRDVNRAYCRDLWMSNRVASLTMRDVTTNRWDDLKSSATFWLTFPFKIFFAPPVDTAGKAAWDMMLRRTETMYVAPTTFDVGATEYFARHLTNFFHTNEIKYSVTLVGHSMGAIVLNELVRRHGDRMHISNVVYMAAACGVDDFTKSVVPYLKAHQNAHFYNLVLHPQNDARETHYSFGEVCQRGSLLEWIDQFYSSRATDFGRTLGKWDNIVEALRGIDPAVRPQITIKAFGLGTIEQHGPQHHGDFSEMKFWKPQFWEPLAWDPEFARKSKRDCD
jgi:pimeloyl-ACP methyl ester carboxylesterase